MKRSKIKTIIFLTIVMLFCLSTAIIGGACGKDIYVGVQFLVDDDVYYFVQTGGNEVIEAPKTPPTKEGHKFEGWYFEPTFLREYEEDWSINKLKTIVKIYAKWSCNEDPFIVENNTIVGLTECAKKYKEHIEIPSEINGNSITQIADSAFRGCVVLKSVVIADGIEKIGADAFAWCKNLKSVQIAESVKEIGGCAFKYCTDLESINLPSEITEIKKETFSHCESLKEITIPNKVEEIGEEAFACCQSLTDISIPDSVEKIENKAFYLCAEAEKISLGKNLLEIGKSAFFGCYNINNELVLPDKLEKIGAFALVDIVKNERLILPTTLTEIGEYAFSFNDLKEIVIPKSVSFIGEAAFFQCVNLNILCEATEKGQKWDENWNFKYMNYNGTYIREKFPVSWGYVEEK
ncbi:MAG: leucine-rich repeat protein [Clostridia bacterium]|nr:leucine-rich repeat protein [Clostridia bacterium]